MEDREEGTKEKTGRKKVSLKRKIYLKVKRWLEMAAIKAQREVGEDDVLKNVPVTIFNFIRKIY